MWPQSLMTQGKRCASPTACVDELREIEWADSDFGGEESVGGARDARDICCKRPTKKEELTGWPTSQWCEWRVR